MVLIERHTCYAKKTDFVKQITKGFVSQYVSNIFHQEPTVCKIDIKQFCKKKNKTDFSNDVVLNTKKSVLLTFSHYLLHRKDQTKL